MKWNQRNIDIVYRNNWEYLSRYETGKIYSSMILRYYNKINSATRINEIHRAYKKDTHVITQKWNPLIIYYTTCVQLFCNAHAWQKKFKCVSTYTMIQ